MSKESHSAEQQLLKSLRHYCQQHLSAAFDKFQPISTTKLTALAANAPSNRLQTLYLDAQRLLRLQGAEIESRTIDSALQPFSLSNCLPSDSVLTDPGLSHLSPDISSQTAQFMGSEDRAEVQAVSATVAKTKTNRAVGRSGRSAGDSLKLVEHEDLEVMIALDNSSSSVREALGGELYELEGRFKSLFTGDSNGHSGLPLSPDALLEAFANSLNDDLIALEVQLELVKIFAEACFDQSYGEMLCLVIDQLAEAGFELVESLEAEQGSLRPKAKAEKAEPKEAEYKAADYKVASFDKTQPVSSGANLVTAESGESGESGEYPEPQGPAERDSNTKPEGLKQSIPPAGVEEQSPAYEGEPLIANTRIQTELLAKISSMLENAEEDARLEVSQQGSSVGHQVGHQFGNARSSQAARQPPCMDKPQLFAEINKHINHLVSHRSELASNGQITRDLAAAIKQLGQGEDGGRLHRNDASVFQVVENTFASFGESMVVAPEVRQVINRCEIPMLKLALKKPVLFEQENHPIRRLFNEMAKYAIGLEQGDCEDNKIYQQMLKLSETMSADSFEERNLPLMLSEFMSIIDRDKRVTSISESREIERVAAREKINWARTRVEEEVAKRMVGKNHAQGVIDFVQRSWCLVLHVAHQQKGEVSSDWQVALKLLDNLLYLASRPASEKDLKYRRELVKHLDVRLGHISTDLAQRSLQIEQLSDALGLNPEPQRSAKITEIAPAAKKWANKMVKKYRPGNGNGSGNRNGNKSATAAEDSLVGEVKRVLMSAVKTELPGKNIAQAVHDAEAIDTDAQRRLATMKTGCWIELGGDIKAHKRGKLAGIVGPSWKYVFVDNQGKLIAERDRARLAVDILNGTVTVLDNSCLFDKAIKEAITQIKGLPVAS